MRRPIGINLSREVRQEAGRSVGARVADVGLGGPSWSPVGGMGSCSSKVRQQDAGDHQGPPMRPSSTLAPTECDRLSLRLMPITAD